ncbi:hypothetical protein OJ998_06145 [Solirubrobacter taibaiensis]|nr:hypothetical protein [Solirubrobacter taibaiensis]
MPDRNRFARLPEIELAELARTVDRALKRFGRDADNGRTSRT